MELSFLGQIDRLSQSDVDRERGALATHHYDASANAMPAKAGTHAKLLWLPIVTRNIFPCPRVPPHGPRSCAMSRFCQAGKQQYVSASILRSTRPPASVAP